MKIADFGDSFITPNTVDYSYTNILKEHFNAEVDLFGYQGSGAWDAFFTFMGKKETYDVVLFVWSSESRTYHPLYRNICPAVIDQYLETDPIWNAAKQYYAYLYDCKKAYYEHVALYTLADSYIRDKHPSTKVIHMWGFPAGNAFTDDGELIKSDHYNWDEAEKYRYLYRFSHGVEIRPALINLSYREEWPVDLSKETRCHHMSKSMHEYPSKYVIDAIENYEPGRLIEIP